MSTGRNPRLEAVSDRILVERSLDQDPLAFGEIVRRHTPIVRAYVARIVGSLSDADDIAQEAFMTAWRQLPSLRDPSALRAWLMRIASREAFQHLKRRPTDSTLDGFDAPYSGDDQPERVAVRNAELRALSAALDELPDDQRRCWLLREVGDLSYAEIAEELGVSAATVRGALARARTSIAVRMEGWR